MSAELLRQASAIYADTGLTPDDLLRQRAELLEARKLLSLPSVQMIRSNGERSIGWGAGELPASQRLTVARIAIARATGWSATGETT